ncbi:MAG TPA: tyrosine-type recombinase/integrase [Pirellulales bacterium]|nr:tyrosine-type recombinase/integrase [Pirellulales bacterium]
MRTPQPYFKRSHRCWYVNVKGKTIKLAADEGEAYQKYHELMAAGEAIRAETTTVQELIGRYLEWCQAHRSPGTYGWYSGLLTKFGEYVGPKLTIDKLRVFHVTQWIDRDFKGTSDNYRHGAIRTVKRACNWAVKQGHLMVSPVANVEMPTPTHRDTVISTEQWKKLLSFVRDQPFHDLLMFMRLTGCRPLEARTAEARHFVKVGQPRLVFDVKESKGKKHRRVIPLSAGALQIVRRLMLKHPEGPLFRNRAGRKWTKDAINCRFDRIKKKLGFRVSLYTIRHTWATRAIENGLDIATVAAIMGHKDATMLLKVYAHLIHNDDRLHQKLEQALGDEKAIIDGREQPAAGADGQAVA